MAPIKLIRKRLLSRGNLHEHKALETYEQTTRLCKSNKANEMNIGPNQAAILSPLSAVGLRYLRYHH